MLWTAAQKTELLETGKVRGFVGHHMKSVKGFPDLAGDPSNIQFLTRAEHFLAHAKTGVILHMGDILGDGLL